MARAITTADPGLVRTLLDWLGPPPEGGIKPQDHQGGEARMLVDGDLVKGSDNRTFANIDPATGETLGAVCDGTSEDLDRAIGAARRAFDEGDWSRDRALRQHCLRQLQEAMRRHVAVLRAVTVAEIGSPVRLTTNIQVDAVIDKIGFMAALTERWKDPEHLPDEEIGTRRSVRRIVREPMGVVGAITPWNIPLDLPMAKLSGALAGGNTIVLKPSPHAPWVTNVVGRLIVEETDIPRGVVNIVTSSDHALGSQLTADPRVDALSFTGSTTTGRKVMTAAAQDIKPIHLELGGKSPNLVLDDADLEKIVPIAAGLGCFNAGQSCILPSRLLVPLDRLDECLDLAILGMSSVAVGDPFDDNTFMGPLISAAHQSHVKHLLQQGLNHSGHVVLGGDVFEMPSGGFWFEPTLVVEVPPDAPLVQQEIFGPIVVVQPYEDEEDAIRIANGTAFGLAAYVWSSDEAHAQSVTSRLRAGMVGINGGNFTGADMPFGGIGHSGLGREWGEAGVDQFLETKSISVGSMK